MGGTQSSQRHKSSSSIGLNKDCVIKIAEDLPRVRDIAALRGVCKTTAADLDAETMVGIMRLRFGDLDNDQLGLPSHATESDREKHLGNLSLKEAYRLFIQLSNPETYAENFGGVGTQDPARFYTRASIEGALSQKVLILDYIYWLQIGCKIMKVIAGNYSVFLRLGMRENTRFDCLCVRIRDDTGTVLLTKEILWKAIKGKLKSDWSWFDLSIGDVTLAQTRNMDAEISRYGEAGHGQSWLKSNLAFDCVKLIRTL